MNRGGSRGCQISHATNVKVAQIINIHNIVQDSSCNPSCSDSKWINIHNSPVNKFHSAAESSVALTYLRQILAIWFVENGFASSSWGSALFTSSMRYLIGWLKGNSPLSLVQLFCLIFVGVCLICTIFEVLIGRKRPNSVLSLAHIFASSDSFGTFIHRED
jgi:hypothetical protein